LNGSLLSGEESISRSASGREIARPAFLRHPNFKNSLEVIIGILISNVFT